jgi:hypothetical protein
MNKKITLNTIAEENSDLSSNLDIVLPSFSYKAEKILSMIDNDTPFNSSDYDDIIPKGKYVYFTNAYLPEGGVKMLKEDYKKIMKLPFDYRDNPNVDDPYDVELKREHYEIAKRIEKFSLDIDSEELLSPKNHDTEEREINGEKLFMRYMKLNIE